MADDVAVMYAGRVRRARVARDALHGPRASVHWGLLQSIPRLDAPRTERAEPDRRRAAEPHQRAARVHVPSPLSVRAAARRSRPKPTARASRARAISSRCHLPVEERRRLWAELQKEHPVLQS